jgi:hypothetical protein
MISRGSAPLSVSTVSRSPSAGRGRLCAVAGLEALVPSRRGSWTLRIWVRRPGAGTHHAGHGRAWLVYLTGTTTRGSQRGVDQPRRGGPGYRRSGPPADHPPGSRDPDVAQIGWRRPRTRPTSPARDGIRAVAARSRLRRPHRRRRRAGPDRGGAGERLAVGTGSGGAHHRRGLPGASRSPDPVSGSRPAVGAGTPHRDRTEHRGLSRHCPPVRGPGERDDPDPDHRHGAGADHPRPLCPERPDHRERVPAAGGPARVRRRTFHRVVPTS